MSLLDRLKKNSETSDGLLDRIKEKGLKEKDTFFERVARESASKAKSEELEPKFFDKVASVARKPVGLETGIVDEGFVDTANKRRTTISPRTSFASRNQPELKQKSEDSKVRFANRATARGAMDVIQDELKALQRKRDKTSEEFARIEQLKTEFSNQQTIANPRGRGAITGLPFGESLIKPLDNVFSTDKGMIEEARQTPEFKQGLIGSKIVGSVAQYKAVGALLQGTGLGAKIASKLGGGFKASQAVDFLTDRIVQAPDEWLPLIKGEKNLWDTFKTLAGNSAIDVGLNLVIGAATDSKGLKELVQGKEVTNLKKVINALGTDGEQIVKNRLKQLDPKKASKISEALGLADDITVPKSEGLLKQLGLAESAEPKSFDAPKSLTSDVRANKLEPVKSQGELSLDAARKSMPSLEEFGNARSAPSDPDFEATNPLLAKIRKIAPPGVQFKGEIEPDAVKVKTEVPPMKQTIAPELPKVSEVEVLVPKEIPTTKIKTAEELSAPVTGEHKSKFVERLERVFADEPTAEVLRKELKKIDNMPSTTDTARIELATKVINDDFQGALDMVKQGNRFNNDIESEIGFQLIDKLQEAGRTKDAFEVIEAVTRKSSGIGQQMQLLKRFSKFTSQGMQKWAVNVFKNADLNVDKETVEQLGSEIKKINSATPEELADMVAKKMVKKPKKINEIVNSIITDGQLDNIAAGKIDKKTAIELLQKQVEKLDVKVAKESLEKLVSDLRRIEGLDEKQLKELVETTLINDGVSIKTATNASRLYNFEELKALNTAVAMGKVMDKIPITVSKKMATFQAMQYLLNVRTFNRNIRGNFGSVIGEQINKLPSAGFDRLIGLKTGQRGIIAEVPQWSKEWDKVREGFKQGKKSVYEIKLGIGRGNTGKYEALFGQAFKSKGIQLPLAKAEKLLRYSLETPDEFFKGWMAADSLHTSVRARLGKEVRNMSLDEIISKATLEEVKEAADYAKYVTFQNDSYLANFLSSAKRGLNKETGKFISRFVPQAEGILNADFGLGNLVVPFTRVPGNIITRGLEYSPLGYLESTRDIARLFKAGGDVPVAFQRQLAQKLGRATTGTGIIATGVFLGNKGIITGDSGTDNFDKSAFDRTQGSGGYKINISALTRLMAGKSTEWQKGDNIHSYSGVEPFSVPLAVGAKISSELTSEEQKAWYKTENLKKGLDAGVNATWEETLDLPALYTIKKMFFESMDKTNPDGSNKEGLDNIKAIMSVPLKEAIPGLTIPSWMRQAAQTIDPVIRETRGDNQIVDKIKANIPFVSKTLAPKLDSLGKEQKRKPGVVANLISPSFETEFDPIPFAEDLDKVYDKTGVNVYPTRNAPNSFSYRGEKVELTAEEKQQWLKTAGAIVEEQFTSLLKGVNVDTIKEEEQLEDLAKTLNAIKSEARERAKIELIQKRGK